MGTSGMNHVIAKLQFSTFLLLPAFLGPRIRGMRWFLLVVRPLAAWTTFEVVVKPPMWSLMGMVGEAVNTKRFTSRWRVDGVFPRSV